MTDQRDFRNIVDIEQSLRNILETRPADGLEWTREQVHTSRTWLELHDAVAKAQRRVRNADVPIPQDAKYRAVDGTTALDGRFEIHSAKHTTELDAWGDAMSNCIGGYRRWALDHTSYLYALYDKGELYANIEITKTGDIRQVYGRFNQPLPDDEDSAVRKAIRSAQKKGARAIPAAGPGRDEEHRLAA